MLNATGINVEVVYHAQSINMTFFDKESAQAAYDKISAALKDYRLFKNDGKSTIEVDSCNGLTTLKLERMDAVIFNDGADYEARIIQDLEFEKKWRAARADMGLPPRAKD